MSDDAGERFQKDTGYSKETMGSHKGMVGPQPEIYKTYPGSEVTALPPPRGSDATLERTIRERRSVRHYSEEPVSMDDLSFLLWASTGISKEDRGFSYRSAPSAGALYPIETYIAVNNVDGIEPGLYHYNIRDHALEILNKGEPGPDLAKACLGQAMPRTAPVVFIWTAVFQRSVWKYYNRAFRYVYLDAAHVAGNLTLAATSLDLGTVQVGAFYDDEMNEFIGVDGVEEAVVYLSPVGRPRV